MFFLFFIIFSLFLVLKINPGLAPSSHVTLCRIKWVWKMNEWVLRVSTRALVCSDIKKNNK